MPRSPRIMDHLSVHLKSEHEFGRKLPTLARVGGDCSSWEASWVLGEEKQKVCTRSFCYWRSGLCWQEGSPCFPSQSLKQSLAFWIEVIPPQLFLWRIQVSKVMAGLWVVCLQYFSTCCLFLVLCKIMNFLRVSILNLGKEGGNEVRANFRLCLSLFIYEKFCGNVSEQTLKCKCWG